MAGPYDKTAISVSVKSSGGQRLHPNTCQIALSRPAPIGIGGRTAAIIDTMRVIDVAFMGKDCGNGGS